MFPIDEFKDNLKNKKYLAEKEIDKKRRDFEEEFDEDGFGIYSNLSRFYGDKVYPFAISKDAKLLDLTKDENIKYFEDNSVPIQKMAKEIDPDSDDAVADMLSHFYDTPAERLIHQEAKRLGFDGVIIEDSSEGMPHKSYVIYDPKFLKHYSDLPNPSRPRSGGQFKPSDLIDAREGNLNGTLLFTGLDITQTIHVLRGLTNNIKEALPHLEAIGVKLYDTGKENFSEWQERFKKTLGDLWDSFKDAIKEVWDRIRAKLADETGSVGLDIKQSIERGKALIEEMLKDHADRPAAMYREEK